jgi:hypothetical protein
MRPAAGELTPPQPEYDRRVGSAIDAASPEQISDGKRINYDPGRLGESTCPQRRPAQSRALMGSDRGWRHGIPIEVPELWAANRMVSEVRRAQAKTRARSGA